MNPALAELIGRHQSAPRRSRRWRQLQHRKAA